MAKTFSRFTLGDPIHQADIFTLFAATELLPMGATRPVSLKVFSPVAGEDKASEFRFAAELRALAAVGHVPHVATLYAAGAEGNVPWILLPHATATAAVHISDNPVAPAVIGQLLEEVLTGLGTIHARGLLHNDLKPANILLGPSGSGMIAELSLAAPPTAEITQQADMVRYAAPEVFSREFGKLSPSTDLYALGQIAYEMALGSRQWRAQFPQVFDPGWRPKDGVNPAKWMAWHCSTQTSLPFVHDVVRNFPQRLGDIIAQLMVKDAAKRFASAGAALSAVREAATASAPAPAAPAKPSAAASAAGRQSRDPSPEVTGPSAATARPIGAAASEARQGHAGPAQGATAAVPVQPVAPPVGGPAFFVRLRNRQTGPFDLATLQRQVRTGLISRLHQVSTDGTHWRPATSIEGLFPG